MTEKEKKQYSTEKYLTEAELKSFEDFLQEANITYPELAEFEKVEPRTIYGRFARKRVERKFAQDFVKSKREALDEKFKNLKF